MERLKARGQTVTYKRFGYGSDGGVEPWRVCYWGHPPHYWDGVELRDCQNPLTNAHTVNLAVIRRFYEKKFKPKDGFTIKTEQRLRRPGDPPRPYSPDLAIYGPNQERMVAVEYQRSYESYEKFCERDELRRIEGWAAVDWWFDATNPNPDVDRPTVYSKSQMHRTHLALLAVPFYRCWVDPQTLELKAECGEAGDLPPNRKKRIERRIEKAESTECSTALVMRELEQSQTPKAIDHQPVYFQARPDSELILVDHTAVSLDRENKKALAVLARQKQLEEQDRRQREWETKQAAMERSPHTGTPLAQPQVQPQSIPFEVEAEHLLTEPAVAKQWGFPFGSTGWLVQWKRGRPFEGIVSSWLHGRPVVQPLNGSTARLGWSVDDYQVIGPQLQREKTAVS